MPRFFIEVPLRYLLAPIPRLRSPYFFLAADLARLTFTPAAPPEPPRDPAPQREEPPTEGA